MIKKPETNSERFSLSYSPWDGIVRPVYSSLDPSLRGSLIDFLGETFKRVFLGAFPVTQTENLGLKDGRSSSV